MKKILLIISISMLLSEAAFAGTCSIENTTPPAVADYLREIDKNIWDITQTAASNSQCRWEAGSFTNERRFLDLIDRIDAQNPVFPDIATDFQYRIMLVVDGDARSPVMRQGEIWKTTEQKIINAMRTVGNACAMDIPIGNGRTAESALTEMLVRNKTIESYYKQVALGNPGTTEADIIGKELVEAISTNYSPEVTAGCKSDSGLEKLKEKSAELLSSISNLGKTTEKANDNWKIAIDLFRGTATNYNDIEKKLLSAELARQWLTQWAAESMLKSLSCVRQKTAQNGSLEEWWKARMECMQPIIIGGTERVKEEFAKIFKPRTTDQYLSQKLRYDQAKNRASRDMSAFWIEIQKKLSSDNEEWTNEKMLTDLVNIHASLRATNTLLEEKIPEMQKNCMKAQPEIVWGCRGN